VLGATLTKPEIPRRVAVLELDGLDAAASARALPDEANVHALDLLRGAERTERGAEGRSGGDRVRRAVEVPRVPQDDALRPGVVGGGVAAGLERLVRPLAIQLGRPFEPAARAGAVFETPAVLRELGRRGRVGGGGGCSRGSKLCELGRRGHILVAEEVGRGSAWSKGHVDARVFMPGFFMLVSRRFD